MKLKLEFKSFFIFIFFFKKTEDPNKPFIFIKQDDDCYGFDQKHCPKDKCEWIAPKVKSYQNPLLPSNLSFLSCAELIF